MPPLPHNEPVSRTGSIFLAALLAVAGCATPAARYPAPPPEWELPPAGPVTTPPQYEPPPPPAQPVAAPATNAPVETWVFLKQWARAHGCGQPQQVPHTVPPAFRITSPTGDFVVQADNPMARWNDVTFHLGFLPRMVAGQIGLHYLDLKKNFEPLLHPLVLPPKNQRVVVIDPGHGGIKPGTQSVVDSRYEKEFTLDWARRLAPLLTTNGWTVYLTRTNDSDVALSNRVAFAEAHHADLFISLHFNSAAPNQKQSGLETYCLTPQGMFSTLTRGYSDNPALALPNNAFDTLNLQYAFRLHRALLAINGHIDRGISHARFMDVLVGQNRPAVLVEGGFLSNPTEARRIATPAYRQQLAEALAGALK